MKTGYHAGSYTPIQAKNNSGKAGEKAKSRPAYPQANTEHFNETQASGIHPLVQANYNSIPPTLTPISYIPRHKFDTAMPASEHCLKLENILRPGINLAKIDNQMIIDITDPIIEEYIFPLLPSKPDNPELTATPDRDSKPQPTILNPEPFILNDDDESGEEDLTSFLEEYMPEFSQKANSVASQHDPMVKDKIPLDCISDCINPKSFVKNSKSKTGKILYLNDWMYCGSINEHNKRNGYGVLISPGPNRKDFWGVWNNDILVQLIFEDATPTEYPSSTPASINGKGQVNRDHNQKKKPVLDGLGMIILNNGTRIDGTFYCGELYFGITTFPIGVKMISFFKNQKPKGYASIQFPYETTRLPIAITPKTFFEPIKLCSHSGSVFYGSLKNGFRKSSIPPIFPKGSLFRGIWYPKKKQAQGTLILKDSRQLSGKFKEIKKNGSSIFYHINSDNKKIKLSQIKTVRFN